MEEAFKIIESVFDGQMNRTELMSTVAGILVILSGMVFIGLAGLYRLKGRPVTLRVINLHTEYKNTEDANDQDHVSEKREAALIRPEFQIMTAPFEGLKTLSSSASSTGDHALGDIVTGYFFPESGDVVSSYQVRGSVKLGAGFMVAGIFIIAIFKFISAQWIT